MTRTNGTIAWLGPALMTVACVTAGGGADPGTPADPGAVYFPVDVGGDVPAGDAGDVEATDQPPAETGCHEYCVDCNCNCPDGQVIPNHACVNVCGDATVPNPCYASCVDRCGEVPDAAEVQDVPPEAADLPPEALDVPPDACGPTTCYDCLCKCADGSAYPYGGCFDACQQVPGYVKDCSADCAALCPGTHAGDPCQGGPGQGTCPSDQYACVTTPCPKCGVPPQSMCQPKPCAIGGCWLDADCGAELRCVGPSFGDHQAGQCLTVTAPPSCWEDADCPAQATCQGGVHCPKCTACMIDTAPGTCKAKPGHEEVVIWVRDSLYLPGENAAVTWFNFTAGAVYLPGCSKYSYERQDDKGNWIDKGPVVMCGVEGIAKKLLPGAALDDFQFPAPQEGLAGGFASYRLHGQYWTGCQDDLPLSGAQCTGGPVDVYSATFMVGLPM